MEEMHETGAIIEAMLLVPKRSRQPLPYVVDDDLKDLELLEIARDVRLLVAIVREGRGAPQLLKRVAQLGDRLAPHDVFISLRFALPI